MNLIEVEAVIESTPFKDYIRTLFKDVFAERNSAYWEFNVAKGTRNGYFGAWLLDIYYNGEAVGVSSVLSSEQRSLLDRAFVRNWKAFKPQKTKAPRSKNLGAFLISRYKRDDEKQEQYENSKCPRIQTLGHLLLGTDVTEWQALHDGHTSWR